MQLSGGQNKDQVSRRFLQNLQQGVESGDGQHMDLVDDIHPVFHAGRGVDRLIPQSADLVHAVVAGRVQLQHVQQASVVYTQTGGAMVAGISIYRMLAVDRLGQNFCAGGLPGATGPGEEVGVREPALGRLTAQGLGDMGLSHHIGEGLGPPFAIQCLIHSKNLLSAKNRGPEGPYSPDETLSASIRSEPEPSRHILSRLMLLGSPPDMVHRLPLRETGTSTRMPAEGVPSN